MCICPATHSSPLGESALPELGHYFSLPSAILIKHSEVCGERLAAKVHAD
jgi:hypothetical protein